MAYSNRERPGGRAGLRDNTPTTFRPVAYRNLAARKNLWADYTTGRGVLDNGQAVPPKIGPRRKNPNLTDMLDTAAAVGVDRIFFTGKTPVATPCLLYTSPSPRDRTRSRMPSSA